MEIRPNERCLICSKFGTTPVTSNSSSLHVPLFAADPTAYNSCLNPHLWSTFVLRHLLELSSDKLTALLEKSGGTSPGEWFGTCALCSQLVREALGVHHQILILEGQLRMLKEQVRIRLKNGLRLGPRALKMNREVVEEKGEEGFFSPQEYILRQVNCNPSRILSKGSHWPQKSLLASSSVGVESGDISTIDLSPAAGGGGGRISPNDSPPDQDASSNESGGEDDDECADPSGSRKENPVNLEELEKEVALISKVPTGAYNKERKGDQLRRKKGRIPFKCSACPAAFMKQTHLKLHQLRSHKKYDIIGPTTTTPTPSSSSMVKYPGGSAAATTTNESGVSSESATQLANTSTDAAPNQQGNAKGNKLLQCHICHRWYTTSYKMVEHLTMHDKYKETTCTVCKFPLTSESLLQAHFNRVHRELARQAGGTSYYWKCRKCEDFECRHPRHKHRHIEKHKFDDNIEEVGGDKWKCKLCPQEPYRFRVKLLRHIREEHGEQVGLKCFRCEQCGKSYLHKNHLSDHVSQQHTKNFKYYCEECGQGYSRLAHFKEHKATHLGAPERERLICDVCGREYVSVRSLRAHKRVTHAVDKRSKAKLFVCTHCGLDCGNVHAYDLHRKAEHKDLFKFHCTSCKTKYINFGSLQRHERLAHGAP